MAVEWTQKKWAFPCSSASARRVFRAGAVVLAGTVLLWASLGLAKIGPDEVVPDVPVYRVSDERVEPLEEVWNFSFSWSGIPVAYMSISGRDGRAEDGPRLDVEIDGKTNAFIDLLWRYRLNAKGAIRLDPFGPDQFVIRENERWREKVTTIEFDGDGNVHSTKLKKGELEEFRFAAPNTYDIISAVFLMMHIDYELGRAYHIDALTGTSRYLVTVRVEAREPIEVLGHDVDAYRLLIETHDLTDPEDDEKHAGTTLWVSTNPPRRLLKAQAATKWGSIYGTLDAIYDSRVPADQRVALFPFADEAIESREPPELRAAERSSTRPIWRGKPSLR
jgi:hypothetical protein